MANNSEDRFTGNDELISRLFNDIKNDLKKEGHPLINHKWIDKNSDKYRLISITPEYSEIQLLELHFELFRYSKLICFEIHPEGNFVEKQRFSKLAQDFVTNFSSYKLTDWSVGGEVDSSKFQNKKIIPINKVKYSFKAGDYAETRDSLKLQLKRIYEDFIPTRDQYISLKLKDKMDEAELNLLKVLNQFKEEEKLNFFSFLDKIVNHLDLKTNDFKINYSIANKRLNFIVGQRYCWNLYSDNDYKYAAISENRISENSKNYKGNPPQPFFNKLKDFKNVLYNESDILESTRKEYEGSLKSGYNSNNKYFEKAVFNLDYRKKIMSIDDFSNTEQISTEQKSVINLNTILYGPPGTGKTYKTKELAIQIANPSFQVTGSNSIDKRKSLVNEYDRLFENGQIVFTTFHQSYSYEDFIEGIKPIPPTTEGEIGYEVLSGIFKNICDQASEKKNVFNFEEIYSNYANDVIEQGTIVLETPVHKKPFQVRINSKETSVAIPKTESATEMGITKEMLKDYILNGNIRDWKPYTIAIGKYLTDNYSVKISQVENEKKNYVIIIDEINRGNVSSIFGELITLLEADKRSNGDEKVIVKLPYSKKPFSIPGNVYIIGTMNTADRSVEALDTALRRRFAFEEVLPKPELLSEHQFGDFNLSEVLKTINDRIEVLLDRDHTIGHSYFLKVRSSEDLKYVFENKIIPLLQEYFYHDYGKIGLILGEGFVQKKENKVTFAKFDEVDVPDEFVTYELKTIENIEEAIKTLLNK
ncbi:McrB family protein [Zunongwangia endophytica]|uniref:McrB family protein n=1 Tax=Zunongwangia endophytica TaxID=1808945 RepID=A0ABV8HB46_9FLAO|nr:AAA family ATPase [Zunongwangia endophytica]MDN3594646.1 AAA family ATPase [Zunongwangia endophytica]